MSPMLRVYKIPSFLSCFAVLDITAIKLDVNGFIALHHEDHFRPQEPRPAHPCWRHSYCVVSDLRALDRIPLTGF